MFFFSGSRILAYLVGVLVFRSNAQGFNSLLLLSYDKLAAPRPIAFRLQGQDPLLILALGDLQWAGGPFCSFTSSSSSSSSSSVLVLSRPGAEKRDPPYPPLVDSPSLPTPCEDREDGYTTRGGWWEFFFRPLGLVTAKPYSRRGLALFFCFGSVWLAVHAFFLLIVLTLLLLCLSYVFGIRFGLFSSQDPWFLPEGVRVVLGHLPCPWSVSAFC